MLLYKVEAVFTNNSILIWQMYATGEKYYGKKEVSMVSMIGKLGKYEFLNITEVGAKC